ncbi:hypothetical protein BDQ12DRAFT_725721 [Crucibulum laeve]|uniref:DUF6533 domain-containing protein n=1 Tax=Crucibulum laeve TaxID=68775 RepID=A0A5C3LRX2_9AGAR|nr:hypothetical protein BDQ12DRAFT_725721 [Crucibulum laeve]
MEISQSLSFIFATSINAAVAFSVLIWDHFQTLPAEGRLYFKFKRSHWRLPSPWAFAALRYTSIVANTATLFLSCFPTNHCQVTMIINQAASVAVIASSSVILGCRVMAHFRGNPAVTGLILVASFAVSGSWLATATQYRAFSGPRLPIGSNCHLEPFTAWAPMSYGTSLIFNSCLLALFILGVDHWHRVNRQCLLYLIFMTIFSAAVLIIFVIRWNDDLVRRCVMPYFTLITDAVGTRVFINFQRHTKLIRDANSDRRLLSTQSRVGNEKPDATTENSTMLTPLNTSAAPSDTRGSESTLANGYTLTTIPATPPGTANFTSSPTSPIPFIPSVNGQSGGLVPLQPQRRRQRSLSFTQQTIQSGWIDT